MDIKVIIMVTPGYLSRIKKSKIFLFLWL